MNFHFFLKGHLHVWTLNSLVGEPADFNEHVTVCWPARSVWEPALISPVKSLQSCGGGGGGSFTCETWTIKKGIEVNICISAKVLRILWTHSSSLNSIYICSAFPLLTACKQVRSLHPFFGLVWLILCRFHPAWLSGVRLSVCLSITLILTEMSQLLLDGLKLKRKNPADFDDPLTFPFVWPWDWHLCFWMKYKCKHHSFDRPCSKASSLASRLSPSCSLELQLTAFGWDGGAVEDTHWI